MDKKSYDILEKAQAGDQDAFGQVYEMYYMYAYAQAFKLCKNEADARDVVQEVFLQVQHSLPQLRNLEVFNGWLSRIVHSKCIRMFARNRDALYDPELLPKNTLPEKRIEHLPSKQVDDKTDKEILRSLLKQLTPKQQEIMDLYYFQEYSIKEIEQLLRIPNGTIKSRMFEAKKALKVITSDFEVKEGRRLSFHLDPVAPSLLMLLIAKLSKSKFLQNTQVLNTMSVIATTGCVAFSVVAVAQSYQVFTNNQAPKSIVNEVNKAEPAITFTPIQFQAKQITNPKSAYFTLKKQAVDEEELLKLSKEQLEALTPILSSLEQSDTTYLDNLVNNNWYNTYKSLK